MTEVKWKESLRSEYLKGGICTCRVYAEEDVDSLSESGKTAIRHLQARFPGIYTPRTAAATAAAPVAPAPTTERLSNGSQHGSGRGRQQYSCRASGLDSPRLSNPHCRIVYPGAPGTPSVRVILHFHHDGHIVRTFRG